MASISTPQMLEMLEASWQRLKTSGHHWFYGTWTSTILERIAFCSKKNNENKKKKQEKKEKKKEEEQNNPNFQLLTPSPNANPNQPSLSSLPSHLVPETSIAHHEGKEQLMVLQRQKSFMVTPSGYVVNHQKMCGKLWIIYHYIIYVVHDTSTKR